MGVGVGVAVYRCGECEIVRLGGLAGGDVKVKSCVH